MRSYNATSDYLRFFLTSHELCVGKAFCVTAIGAVLLTQESECGEIDEE